MTLTDYTSRNKGPPKWIEEDEVVSVQGHVGEDIVVELKLASSENYDDLRLELIRDGVPISSDRYRLSMRGNIVQLTLKQSHKNDAGCYSLVATRLGHENDKGALKKIHLSVGEPSYEEGDPPIFLRRLSDLAVKVGTRTKFLVEIRSSTSPKITWYKDDSPIQEKSRFSLVHEGNFHCVDVAPVTIEDQGCWTCMAENRSGRSSCTSTLTVIVPNAYKRPEFVEELRALLTETAGTVSLECKVIGVPTPVLKWFKDNKEIKAGDVFALTANPDDPTSLGVYTCEAINCMGTAYSSSKVHVVGRGSREGSLKPADALAPTGPLPVFKQILRDECCRIEDALVLSCRVQVPPWPKAIAWYNKGGRVETSEKYHIMEDGIGGYSIRVKQVEAVDEGEWKCIATSEENMKQFTSCYVAMSIPRNYRKPRFMENLKAVLTEEGLVSFECKVVGFPTPLLRWFKDGQELKPGDVYQLTGTNSLGSYCCIARNCMGEAKSTAELTIEDIQNQLNEEERFQLLSANQPPKFIKSLRSCEARINEDFRFMVQVSIVPEPTLSWYRDDVLVDESDRYHEAKENLGVCQLEVRRLEFIDQAEWKCVAANDFGHSVTSCFLKLIIPKHYKKPKFLESLRAILSEEGAVNLECKVIGVPQPILKWYKDNVELKPGDIHRIISGQDGTCCLGTYTCEATNCMGTVSSSASLLGFEDKKHVKEIQSPSDNELARNLSLSTIHEERTSQLYDTPQTDHSVTLDERGEVSFSFDGREVSVSLYETPDLTEEEALQIVEMYADELSEHVTEHNVIELPPMRFVKETSTSGNLLMEAVVIDVSPDYFVSAEEGDDLRTEADFEDVSIMDDVTRVTVSSPERDSRNSFKKLSRNDTNEDEKVPNRPPRRKSTSASSSKSERSQQQIESESFHSAQRNEPPLSPLSSLKQDDSETFADALSSAHLSITESLIQTQITEHGTADSRKRSLSAGRSTASGGSSLDDGIGGDSSFDSATGIPKKKQRKKKQRKDKSNSEEYSFDPNDQEGRRRDGSEDGIDTKIRPHETAIETVDNAKMDIENEAENEKEIQESTKDILLETRMDLHDALETYEKILPDTLAWQFFDIRERFDDINQILRATRGKGTDIETLINLEVPLHASLKAIDKITSAEDAKIIRDIFQVSIVRLLHVVENLKLQSLQPTLTILRQINERICSSPDRTEKLLSSTESISDDFRDISAEIVNPLIDIQSALGAILDYTERSKPAVNGAASPQPVLTTSGLAACLAELKECVSHTAYTAMTSKKNETLNSLMEFREPLLDLQLALTSEGDVPWELSMIKETTLAIVKLKNVVVTILENSGNYEAISRVGTILGILEDTDRQISNLTEQLSKVEATWEQVSKSLNVDQSLSGVHFALSSVLEKHKDHAASCHRLIECIETLRQAIGSSAVTIANMKNPINDEIAREISKLNESLSSLQRDLLTEKHEPEEEQILNNLTSPIGDLKKIVQCVIKSSSLTELIVPMLQLLEEIEKDVALVGKEISKKKCREESIAKSRIENIEDKSNTILATEISRSLDPLEHWLLSITSEESTKDEMESELSSTIRELKRDVSQIAVQTSHSEPPSDENLTEALIDLRKPLLRLEHAISVYHKPEDLSTLENLDRCIKHLLRPIVNVLCQHKEEESLLSIVDIVGQIENQISLLIEDALYQREFEQSAETRDVETKHKQEEQVVVSGEINSDTLTEIASTPFEAESIVALPAEQIMTKDESKGITTDDIAPRTAKEEDEKQKREESARDFIIMLSETLGRLQLEMTGILEDFEESTTRTTTIPQSKLANCLEELRRTVSTICVMTTVYGKKIESFQEKINQAILVLTNLTQPLTNIQELLSRSYEHNISELMILNRLTPLLNTIEDNVIKQTIDFVGKDEDTKRELEFLRHVAEEIKSEIPFVIEKISSRRKILECLWDISKPVESISEHMNDLEKNTKETLETDVANILGKPVAAFLESIKTAVQEVDMLDRRGSTILHLRHLLEPLLEFHSCLSMVQSSRRSLAPEASLLDERRSVILRAIEDLRKQVCHTAEVIANMEGSSLFNDSLTLLNSAILEVQKQIGKTDYSRRSSSVKVSLQHRLTDTLSRLSNAIVTLEEHADKGTYGIVTKCLETLRKQISFVQMQFVQIDDESIDEEAIVEGFLYPTNQLLLALNVLKESTQKISSTIPQNLMVQFQELADSISELSSSLSAHKTKLVQEGASNGAPIIETFSAVIDVLDQAKDSIMTVEKMIESVERKASSAVVTKVEDGVADEVAPKISHEKMQDVTTITETPLSEEVAQAEVVQLEIEGARSATPVLENLASIIDAQQVERKQVDEEKNQEEIERQERLTSQISKFYSTINNMAQPLTELIGFVKSATQESLVSKSEENKRKIQELTALMQILYDLQATNASIKTALSSLSVVSLNSQFSRMKDIFVDFQRAIDAVISLTHGGIKPELKESIMTSLQSIAKPLVALKNELTSACRTTGEDKSVDKDGKLLPEITRALIPCISGTIESLNAIEISKYVRRTGEREMEMSRVKEEAEDIEETTARPLEELIEAIMDSQEQVQCNKTLPSESSSPFTDRSIESKDTDSLIPMEVEKELSEALVRETEVSMRHDSIEIPQQTSTSSLAHSQIEESIIEEKGVTKSAAETLEQVEEQSVATIDQQKVDLTRLSESGMTQEDQVEFEALQATISRLQILSELFDEMEEIKVLKSFDKAAFSALTGPLLRLALPSAQITEELKQDALQKLSAAYVLEELQRSVASVQEQVQLDSTITEADSSETFKMQNVEKLLQDLKMSIACVRSDSMTRQLQQGAELSSVKQITVLQTVAKTVEQFGEKFVSVIKQAETDFAPSSQIVKREDQLLEPEILHKIIDPIHILREAISRIKDLENQEVKLLEILEQEKEVIQLSAVMDSLEKLERSLVTGAQRIAIPQEEVAKNVDENQVSLTNANLKPVLEELKDSIILIQQQVDCKKDIPAVKILNETVESLKLPLAITEEIIDHFDEITETEKVTALLTFAETMEETANRLVIATKQNVEEQQEIRETYLLKTMPILIEGLQSAILKLEDRVSQILETKESIKVVALECMTRPLQELQQSLLTTSHLETALSLQQLPIKPILDSLNKSIATIQDQLAIVQDNLGADANTDDLAILKDFTRSLDTLRISTVVVQQLNAIENAGQQIVEIENVSALQAFAKSIEEFKKCSSVIVEQPKAVEAFTTNVGLEQSAKVNTQLVENIIAPLRILQEQILTIEETKMQESEMLDITEIKRPPVTVLSSLVGPLQQLEKSFVATVQKEHTIEHNGRDESTNESSLMNVEKLALQPILEEVQRSIATVQEHVILEAGGQIISEAETDALLKSIAQPLVDLRASIASIQQITAVEPDSLNELAQQQNVPALETFAESLHNLTEHIAMCNHQQVIMEPAADTISEDASSLNTWADVIEEPPLSKVTRPMVIEQGAIESPMEATMSIPEDETSTLKTLAKPLTELRECLALIIEEHKIIASNDTTELLTDRENISLLKTMVQPLLELKDAAAVIIQEQTAIERASEHSFALDGKNELALRPLMVPLEELHRSLAEIHEQMLIETLTDRSKSDTILNALAEPLYELQRAISVLETRVISPDVESMPEDTSNSWITECLTIPLHEIERSIADIRQCIVIEPESVLVKEPTSVSTPYSSIVETLAKPVENIKSAISRMNDDSEEIRVIKTMAEPLTDVQEKLKSLKDKCNLCAIDEKSDVDAVVESLFNLEKCISFVEREIVDKPMSGRSYTTDTDTFVALNVSLTELRCSITGVKEPLSAYLSNMEKPLQLMQNALETISSTRRNKKLSELSTKMLNAVSNINESIESVEKKLDQQRVPIVEFHIECATLGMLTKPLQNIKRYMTQIQEKSVTADLMISALRDLEKSIAIIREQSADKPFAESQRTNFSVLLKSLIPCLHELQESIEATKTLWHEETILEGLMILEKPICELEIMMGIMCDQILVKEWIIDEHKISTSPEVFVKEGEKELEEIEATVRKEKIKLEKDADSITIVDDKEKKKKDEKTQEEQRKEIKDKKSVDKELEQQKDDEAGKEKKTEGIKDEKKRKKKVDEIQSESEEGKKDEAIKKVEEMIEGKESGEQVEQVEITRKETEKDIKDKKGKDKEELKKTKETESLKKNEETEKVEQIQKEEQMVKMENIETMQKEKDERKIDGKEINEEKEEKGQILKDEKPDAMQKDIKDEKSSLQENKINANQLKKEEGEKEGIKMEEQKATEKIKKKEGKKIKSKKVVEELERKKEESDKRDESAQEMTKQQKEQQHRVEEIKEQERKQMEERTIETKIKEEEGEKAKDDLIEKVRKEDKVFNKKEEIVERTSEEEEQKKKDEIERLEKEGEKQEETGQIKELKQEKTVRKEEDKVSNKMEEIVERTSEEEEQKKKDEIERLEKEGEKREETGQIKELKQEKTVRKEEDKVSNKKEEIVERTSEEEEQKKKDEIERLKKENEKREETGQIKELKQEKTVRKEEDKVSNKMEEIVERTREEEEQKKKDEIERLKKEDEIREETGQIKELKQEKTVRKEEDKVSNKMEEIVERTKEEEEQKKKDEIERLKKEDEIREETGQIKELKQKKTEEDKKQTKQTKNKREDKKVKEVREEYREKNKEEIVKREEFVESTQSGHTNDVQDSRNKEDRVKSKREYEEAKEDRGRQEEKEKETLKQIQRSQSKEDKDLHLKTDEDQERQKYDETLQRQQADSKSQFEEMEKSKRREEERRQREPRGDEICMKSELRTREEQTERSDERKKEGNYDQRRNVDRRLHRIEMDGLERKRAMERSKKEETDRVLGTDKESLQKRDEQKRIRRNETDRLLWEEEQRLQRKKQEEEMSRNKQRREEQIRESEWLRRHENESDYFLRNMMETRCKTDKLTGTFFDIDYPRDYTSRLSSSVPILSSIPRSYSWRDSLTSLNRRRTDDYWDYKLRGSSMDKYYLDIGSSSYRRRRRRENRIIRARSTSLLKYEDYSTGESNITIVPSTRIRTHFQRAKTERVPGINFNTYDYNPPSSYADLGQSESLSWSKPKKPSFCMRLTNRLVGVGMSTRLTCIVLGNPEPRVHWMKDGEKLDVSNGRYKMHCENGIACLELHDALPTDTGIFTCVAENTHGTSTTESTLRVYSDYKPTHSLPMFVRPIKDTYRYSDNKLVLECCVRAHPAPSSISWLKDGKILQGERYKQSSLDNDIYRLEIADPNVIDDGRYTCRAANELHIEEMSHAVHVEDWQSRSRYDSRKSDEIVSGFAQRPQFSNLLKDHSVPAGGTIALQVEVKGVPAPEVKWLHGDRKEPIAIPKAQTFAERGLYTLIVPEATESERGTYVCRAINVYGQVDTSATVNILSQNSIDGGKPAMFVSRPSKKSIDVTVGEDVSISFRVSGVPKPRVMWMKGLTDITDGLRSYKESIDDYVRLTLKRAVPSDEGTYCIMVKNRYGCDRSFFSIKVKQRARSLTPSPDWNFVNERDAKEYGGDDMSYVRNVPGPISSEPVVVDGGKNWLSLSWGKAERRGPAPVISYKVEAWLLGSDGGARWTELGITPINAFDAFNLRPGREYKFRVTPRNRYGWGEPVTMTNSAMVSESTDLPEFTKILSGQLKALEGTAVKLECEIRGDSKMVTVRWYRETTEIGPHNDSRFAIYYNDSKCSLTIANVKENDSGRYVCEASNRIGKVSTFARLLVVTDPKIIEADAKLKTSLSIEREDRPPQFIMRIRDRRVQATYPVRLTCQVVGYPVPEVTWYKNEVEISQDDRHIFWDDDSNFHTLEIIHSTLDDSGCYMVMAKNINGSVSCRCTLVVDKGIRAYIAPEFLRGLDAVYTIHSGKELRMSAQLEAYPSVGVVWHRDGIRLRPSRKTLMTLSHDGTVQFSLTNATARDAGIYCCTATNVIGHAETSTRVAVILATTQDRSSIDESSNVINASPNIPYSKEPLFVTKPLSTEAVEGDTVIILCEVVGDPKPEVIWLRDFLKPNYYRDAPHFRLVGAGPQYQLEIPYAKLDFTGTYSVIARNQHGEAKAVISLQIYAKGQGKEEQTQKSPHGKMLTLPIIKRELRDLRCCDGDAVSLECQVYATPEPPFVRWERGGKIIATTGDFAAEFDGETARLIIQHVYPEDEGEYTCVAYNELGKAYTSACLVVDVPEGKENTLSQRLTRPTGLLSAGSTPRSTPRSTPIRSLSPAILHGREFRSPQILLRSGASRRPKICPPKFYAVPHNRLVQEGETVRFQCAVIGHPTPWIRWDKNDTVVTPSARISIKERNDVKILEIVDVMQEDAGLYRITAENDFGRIEASARLEVINRYESTSRIIRTRSASPKTYPSFDRSLLPTIGRVNGRLQLECRVRGRPNVTPTWYRNGKPLERSVRIKRHFDGMTARIEISKVNADDAGEYTCVATNFLGSTRSSCQVTILDLYDSSAADKRAPQFLQSLPEESTAMENHCHEFQVGVTGTPPFTVIWCKDGRELFDSDYYRYIIYRDGSVALRLSEICARDAGEYTCVVRNDFGSTSCSGLLAVQDYKNVPKLALQFTKTPLSVIVAKGTTACFCARAQCGKTMKIIWMINGKDARDNAKCKIERDGSVSVLKVCDISSRDAGEIRCTVSVNGKGPSISCIAKLQLLCDFNNSVTKPKDIQFHSRDEPSPTSVVSFTSTPERNAELLSSLNCRRQCEKSALMRIKSSSFPRQIISCAKHVSSSPAKTHIPNDASTGIEKLQFGNQLVEKITKKNLDSDMEFSNDQKLSSPLSEKNIIDASIKSSKETGRSHRHDAGVITNEDYVELCLKEEAMKATIIKKPADVIVFKGNKAVLGVTYQGHPEPTVKWLRVNQELQPSERTGITSENGVSHLTLYDVTYNHAGKYQVSVENPLGEDRKFFSLAVEGPPEPLADKPSVKLSADRTTIIWRSPPYDGGRAVTGYTVEAKRAGESTWTVIAESCHSLSHTIPTVETNFVIPSETYRYRIRAENIHGLSDPGMESDPVRIMKQEETMLEEDEEDELESSIEARAVEAEERALFDERYDVLEELGKGRYGIVKKVTERATGMSFAAKFVRTIKAKDREQVREEIKIMNALRHPKLLLLAAVYTSPRETVLITEYISGGELFERVVADDFTLTEKDSILFIRQICQAVGYMHKNKIVHLDLKPENIMCRTRTSHRIKLIDFGLAQTLKSDTPVRVLLGTPEFIPPEIISYEPIGVESDMWSIGVICYVLLTGLSPFMGDNDAETFANITRADYDLEDEAFDAVSNNAKDFISGLLIKRKELRMSATQCLEHPWMTQHAAAMSRVLPTEKLKKFIIRRKWQKTGNAIRALGRMAILSAYSRRSPPITEELSPTIEQRLGCIETQYPDERIQSVDKDTKRVDISAEENSTEAESRDARVHSICTTEVNVQIQQKSSIREESHSNSLLKHIDEKRVPELDTELIPTTLEGIPQNVTAHLKISLSKENERNDKELIEKASKTKEQCATSKSQVSRRVLRDDSRDSRISDRCTASQVVTLQADKLEIASTTNDETTHVRESKRAMKTKENWQGMGAPASLEQDKGNSTVYDTEVMTDDDKVATKNGVTKASCETNPVRKGVDENTDARILSGYNRDRFVPTGNVSRTARIFEKECGTSKSDDSRVTAAQYPTVTNIGGKPHNERIQKAFAFWNK